jgi:threonine dehydratase
LAGRAGAVPPAALLYRHRAVPNEKVVVIMSGGNVTDEVLLRALKTR